MSQEARLKLRMQKELKLLLADPPHGASFPFLSSNSDITDLCSIDAQIEGPEETVYSKGIFKIKIQIPERYPLQPPIVTFATPIYHPNIDNGGRICLDILNLPPKGAWQPSLNISTVLTSIRLLLTEPNPDDGLMCEASREYKYNRQAFDHKARSMTEKFAKAGAGESSCSNQCTETKVDSAMVEVQGLDKEPNHDAQEFNPSLKRSLSISQKLSLDSTSSNKKKDVDDKVPNHNLVLSTLTTQMESKRKRDAENDVLNEYNPNNEKVNGKGRRSPSKASDQCKYDFDNKENVDPNYLSSLCQHPASFGSSLDSLSSNKKKDADQKVLNHNLILSASVTQMESKRKREKENDVLNEYNLNNEKVSGKGKISSLKKSDQCKDDFDNKENVDPNFYLSPLGRYQQLDQHEDGNAANSSTKSSSKLCQSQKQPFGSMEPIQTCENVIVLGTVEESYVDRTKNVSANKKPAKISSVGKKLSLGLKGPSHRQKLSSNKENVMPFHSLPFSKPQTPGKIGLGPKLSLVPSTQQLNQENEPNQKKQSHQAVQSMQTDLKVKDKEIEEMEEESSVSEKVVVLDSEESEGEGQPAPLRTRMPLASRKRLGKWRV